jgi:diguanylate cyclase (GGDEF)-like protein
MPASAPANTVTDSGAEPRPASLHGGVLDEDAFRRLLTLEANRATRYRDFFVLCLVQPDQISPKEQADEMLGERVARKIVEFVRSSDVVGRLGEGIGVLLLQAESADASRVTERLRNEIGNVRFQEAAGPGRKVTVSVVEASFPADGHNESLLLSRARARLLEAVRSGGDRGTRSDNS